MLVTVQKIWPLDPTKKSGGFKGTDGVNYYCEIGAYHMLSEGATYEADARPYVSKSTGKQSFIMPKEWHPPATAGNAPQQNVPAQTYAQAQPAPPRPATNGAAPPPFQPTVGDLERQGYIVVCSLMKTLAEAQVGAGKPIDTQDLPLLAQAAVTTWREHIKGKV